MKTAIITGANSGIGFETAKRFAQNGYNTVMVVRNEDKGRRSLTEIQKLYPEAKLELMLMDMASMASIRKTSAEIIDKVESIDVLINAAGLFSTKPETTQDGYDMTYGVNYLGTYLFTMLLLPKMKDTARNRGDVRIISISSFGHKNVKKMDLITKPRKNMMGSIVAYGNSKMALNIFTEQLAKKYGDDGITAVTINPGTVHTNLIRKDYNNPLMYLINKRVENRTKDAVEADVPADAIIWLAEGKEAKQHNGGYFDNKDLGQAKDPEDKEQQVIDLLKLSEKITGIGMEA